MKPQSLFVQAPPLAGAVGFAVTRRALRAALCGVLVGLSMSATTIAMAAVLKAEYRFNGTLSSSVPGAPALVSVDPLGLNGFAADTVDGRTQPVFSWNGNATPVSQEAGLTLDTAGLVSSNDYSVELVFKLTQRPSLWRRILDVSNRQSDDGFYVDLGNYLAVYPIISSQTPFTNNVYQDVLLTVGGGRVSAYLNGKVQFSEASALMNITNAPNSLIFFLDNTAGSGQGEFSNGSIALLRLYAGVVAAPSLVISRTAGNTVTLSWPSPSLGFVLQQNPDLRSTNWTRTVQVPTDDGVRKQVVASLAGTLFYRLFNP